MHVLVVGGGVTGLATAWYLVRDGHAVTLVERHADVAQESSFANGGQLSYSYVAPLAGPGVLSHLPSWLIRQDSPVRFRPRADPRQWLWLMQFLSACTRKKSELATRRLLALSFLSRELMRELILHEPSLRFDHTNAGKLVVFRDARTFAQARRLLDYQRSLGCEQEALDAQACVRVEGALSALAPALAGGIYTRSEDSADCHRFCVELSKALRARGVHFMFGATVTGLRTDTRDRSRIRADVNGESIAADHVVVCAGAGSADLLRPLGIGVPLYPLKGYSLTAEVRAGDAAPRVSVTDFDRKIVYARLGNRLRIAGMADITGRSASPEHARIETLKAQAAAAFPRPGGYTDAMSWCGLRPATPTSTPLIGKTRYSNLWLNLGHGALGFTLALGSGLLISELVAGCTPSIPIEGFSVRR